jgi:hypothetical protein
VGQAAAAGPLSLGSDDVEATYETLRARGVGFGAPRKKEAWGDVGESSKTRTEISCTSSRGSGSHCGKPHPCTQSSTRAALPLTWQTMTPAMVVVFESSVQVQICATLEHCSEYECPPCAPPLSAHCIPSSVAKLAAPSGFGTVVSRAAVGTGVTPLELGPVACENDSLPLMHTSGAAGDLFQPRGHATSQFVEELPASSPPGPQA